jgi:hypothetical protein
MFVTSIVKVFASLLKPGIIAGIRRGARIKISAAIAANNMPTVSESVQDDCSIDSLVSLANIGTNTCMSEPLMIAKKICGTVLPAMNASVSALGPSVVRMYHWIRNVTPRFVADRNPS